MACINPASANETASEAKASSEGAKPAHVARSTGRASATIVDPIRMSLQSDGYELDRKVFHTARRTPGSSLIVDLQ